MTDSHELAWLAGFWDGEGHVGNHTKYATPFFSLGQAGGEGKELCERVLRAADVGRGAVNGPYAHTSRQTPYYMVRITGGLRVSELLEKCRPWLSRTKVAQAEAVLEKWHEYRRVNNVGEIANRTHCNHGHEFNEKNTGHNRNGYRYCRRCAADCEARRRALKKTQPRSEPLAS